MKYKKIILSVTLGFFVTACTIYNFCSNKEHYAESFLYENIEALAQSETDSNSNCVSVRGFCPYGDIHIPNTLSLK